MRALLLLAASLLPLGASAGPRFELKGELVRLTPRLVPQLDPLPGDAAPPFWPRELEDWSSQTRRRALGPSPWRPPTRRTGKLTTLVGVTTFLRGRAARVQGDEDWTVEASSFVPRAWFSGSSAVDRLAYASATGEILFFRGSVLRPSVGLATGLGGFTRGPLELGVVLVLEASVGLQLTLPGDLRACLELAYQVAPCVDCPRDLARPQGSWPVLTLSLRYRPLGGARPPFPWRPAVGGRGGSSPSARSPPPEW